MDKIGHAHDSGDVSRVVAKEDTTERGKRAHEVSLDRDGSLNAVDVCSRDEIMRTASHCGECVRLHGYQVGVFGRKGIGAIIV